MTSTGRSSRAVGRARREPPRDPVGAGVEVWTTVVSGLEAAHYADVGTEYAKLSALLVQQRTAQLLAGAPVGEDWAELSRLAQRALDLLDPLLGAARLLATMPAPPPTSAPAPPTRRTAPRGSRAAGAQPARTRTTTPPAPRAAAKRS